MSKYRISTTQKIGLLIISSLVSLGIVAYISPMGRQYMLERKIKSEFSKVSMPSDLQLKYIADFGDVILDNYQNWGVTYAYNNTNSRITQQQLYVQIYSAMTNAGFTVEKKDEQVIFAKNENIKMRINVGQDIVGFQIQGN